MKSSSSTGEVCERGVKSGWAERLMWYMRSFAVAWWIDGPGLWSQHVARSQPVAAVRSIMDQTHFAMSRWSSAFRVGDVEISIIDVRLAVPSRRCVVHSSRS